MRERSKSYNRPPHRRSIKVKADLAEEIVRDTGIPLRMAELALDVVWTSVMEELVKGNSLRVVGFGRLLCKRKGKGRNLPQIIGLGPIPPGMKIVYKAPRGWVDKYWTEK